MKAWPPAISVLWGDSFCVRCKQTPRSLVSPLTNDQLCSLQCHSVNTLISRYNRAGTAWRERRGCVLFVLLHLQKLLCTISSWNQSLTHRMMCLKSYLVCTLWSCLFFLRLSPASPLRSEWELQNHTGGYQKPWWWEHRTNHVKLKKPLLYTLIAMIRCLSMSPSHTCLSLWISYRTTAGSRDPGAIQRNPGSNAALS